MKKKKRMSKIVLLAILLIIVIGVWVVNQRKEHQESMESSDHQTGIDVEESPSTEEKSPTTAEESISTEELASTQEEQDSEELQKPSVNKDRTVYQKGFYYEPIPTNIKKKMNSLSYQDNDYISYDDLRYVQVKYVNFENKVKTGELIVNKTIAQDIVEIFYELYLNKYAIDKIKLIDEYGADDEKSMEDNNTASFNFREQSGGTKLSNHAYGLAIDINPVQNPYVKEKDGKDIVLPVNGSNYTNRGNDFIGKISETDLCYKLFMEHGFSWGGNWNSLKDYQHFEKTQ